MKKRADIVLAGCHDSTHLLDVELTDEEMALLGRIADLSVKEGGGCQPTMRVSWALLKPPADASCQECFASLGDRPYERVQDGYAHITCEEESK